MATNDRPLSDWGFWNAGGTWKNAGRNTTVCLIGCTTGDMSAWFYLQHHHPDMAFMLSMAIAMTAGICTSILLETVLLRLREGFAWGAAARTALTMSLVSMMAMEASENLVNYALTGGGVDISNPVFWGALLLSILAGCLVPLPYNYYKLRRLGHSCHSSAKAPA